MSLGSRAQGDFHAIIPRSLANTHLFNLGDIDLSGIAVSEDEVGRMNPQCGDMRQLDYVAWVTDDFKQGVGIKHVRETEFWVPYHIPGRPLLPGVLMIEAAAQLSSIMFCHRVPEGGFLGFTRCNDVVFRGQVVPGDTLYLLTDEISFRRRQFVTATQGIVNDKLVFEATITGMVM